MFKWLTRKTDAAAICSFCRKGANKVGALVEGPGPQGEGGVYICQACAQFSLSIFEREGQRPREAKGGGEPAAP